MDCERMVRVEMERRRGRRKWFVISVQCRWD
jgi:hypothetical protein